MVMTEQEQQISEMLTDAVKDFQATLERLNKFTDKEILFSRNAYTLGLVQGIQLSREAHKCDLLIDIPNDFLEKAQKLKGEK